MKPSWYCNITFESLPPDFQASVEAMAESIRPLLSGPEKDRSALAARIALEGVKSDMALNEGRNNRYYPWFGGDKFSPLRHEAIRADYRAKKNAGTYNLREFLDAWNLTERTLGYIRKTGPDPRQGDMFPDPSQGSGCRQKILK